MDILALLQTDLFWTALQTGAVIVSFAFLAYQVRLQRYTHLVGTLQVLDDRWNSDPMLKARKLFGEAWKEGNRTATPTHEYILEFFELLAIYRKEKAIPNQFLWQSYSWYIENYYCLMYKDLREIRKTANDPSLYAGYDDLYATMRKISAKKNIATYDDEAALLIFVEREIEFANLSLELGSRTKKNRKRSDPA